MLRRLFQRLEQRVERALREHVHFVDDVDLHPRDGGLVFRALDDLAHVVDAGMRGSVHLDHVDMAAIDDRLAMHAQFRHVHGRLVDGGPSVLGGQRIIERARENAGGGGLADAAHAGEHVGLVHAAELEGVGEDADHQVLPDQLLETLGPILSRENPVGGGRASCPLRRGRQRRGLQLAEETAARGLIVLRAVVRHLRLLVAPCMGGAGFARRARRSRSRRLDRDPPGLVRAASFRT